MKVKTRWKKNSFLKNVGFFLGAREKVFNEFNSRIFPIKDIDEISTPEPEPGGKTNPKVFETAKTKRKISPLKLRKKVFN